MTEHIPNELRAEPETSHRPSPLLLIGGVLWVLCLIGICFGWYQWRQRVLSARTEEVANILAQDDGRVQKRIKLVPQKDGSLIPVEMTAEEEANPWDAEGIEDFSFTDTTGKKLSKSDLIGKPFVISFVFTQCRGPCPNVTLQMRELQDRLKDYDFNLVTLTVDPERDTMETLEGYGRENGANFDRWKFLTGDQSEIYGLIHRGFKMPVEEAKGESRVPGFEIIHSTNIMLVDATGRVIGKYNAQKLEEMSKLRRQLKQIAKLKMGAAEPIDEDGK